MFEWASVFGPKFLIKLGRTTGFERINDAGTNGRNNATNEYLLAEAGKVVDHSGIRQKLAEVAVDGLGGGGIGSAEVDEEDAFFAEVLLYVHVVVTILGGVGLSVRELRIKKNHQGGRKNVFPYPKKTLYPHSFPLIFLSPPPLIEI